MNAEQKSIKNASIKEIEAAVSEAFSKFSDFLPSSEIRLIESVKQIPADVLSQDRFRIELFVNFPKLDKDKDIIGF
ncbi:MAG: hypothetical protein IT473_07305 [Lysobacter sp.]|nr:hypothetical protein [Lysobacter sp.]